MTESLLILLSISSGHTSGSTCWPWIEASTRRRLARRWRPFIACSTLRRGRSLAGIPSRSGRRDGGNCLRESKAAAAPFAEALDSEISELLRLETLLEPPTNLQSCHRDLWADNMLPTPTGGLCVIDWENCGLADPAQELPMAMIDFGSG